MVAAQLFVSENAPLAAMLVISSGVVPLFDAVTDIGALGEPTATLPNARVVGFSVRVAVVPLPES
jgi:hypothetical protein